MANKITLNTHKLLIDIIIGIKEAPAPVQTVPDSTSISNIDKVNGELSSEELVYHIESLRGSELNILNKYVATHQHNCNLL